MSRAGLEVVVVTTRFVVHTHARIPFAVNLAELFPGGTFPQENLLVMARCADILWSGA